MRAFAMTFRLPLPLACCAGLAGFAAVAAGQSMTVDLSSITPTNYALVSGHAGDESFTDDVVAGLNLTVESQSGLATPYPTTFEAFCVELAQNIDLDSTGNNYTVVAAAAASSGVGTGYSANIPLAGIGQARANNLEILYAHVFGPTYNPAATFTTPDQTEAFQLALWKLSQDDGFDLTDAGDSSTGFWVTSTGGSMGAGALSEAQALLNWVAANPNAAKMDLVALHSGSLQDLLVPAATQFTAIPEASNYAQVLGLAVLAFTFFRKRLHRSHPAAT